MSQHRSLRAASTLGGKRNVLKRFERTALLEKRGQRKVGDRITGLRKTKPEAISRGVILESFEFITPISNF